VVPVIEGGSSMRRLVLPILFLAAALAPALGALAQENDVAGSWVAVKAEREGMLAEDLVGHELIFEGNRFAIASRGAVVYAGTYALDPVAEPPAIDFQHEAGRLVGTSWEGIYELNADRLVICDDAADPNNGRPGDFTTSPGSGRVMITFTRR
jgi:uncharacterized protein (TIGR03067 family)